MGVRLRGKFRKSYLKEADRLLLLCGKMEWIMREEMEAKEYKYSVLMSVYKNDNPDYLIQAVESMLQQTVLPEQFVLVVDGPVSGEINTVISKYEGNEGLFTVVRIKENGGLANALNVGLEYCRNELVARMDADDISLPTRCERELEMFARNKKLALCGTHIDEFYDVPENVHTVRKVPLDYESIKKFIKRRQPFNHPTVMYRKSEVIRCGGYGQLKRKQDFDLFSRMINEGCYALNVDASLLKFRADRGSYKRRKSWDYVKSSIYVGFLNFKRGYCSIVDFAYIVCGQMALYIMPLKAMAYVSDNFLREKKKYGY
ncbi:MAG: glycosyltransferase [Butyrivibrio sp.]|nr:glycosyltransferase [Butyrivibrio sp.]